MSHANSLSVPIMSHTKFNLSQCAEMAGVNRKTIQRYVSSGKLSVERDNKGKPFIELSELLRVYPSLSHPAMDKMSHTVPQGENVTITQAQFDKLINKIESLESVINDLALRLEHKPAVKDVEVIQASEPTTIKYDDGVMTLDFEELSIANNMDMLGKK